MLTFEPVKTADQIIIQIMETKNKIAVLKIKHNKLIDELMDLEGEIEDV